MTEKKKPGKVPPERNEDDLLEVVDVKDLEKILGGFKIDPQSRKGESVGRRIRLKDGRIFGINVVSCNSHWG